MGGRQNISSGSIWEQRGGYSRAVRVGERVLVSGTTASDAAGAAQGADVYQQCRYIYDKIGRALAEAGATLADVVRTRIYLRDVTRWEEASRAHAELFGAIRPANTLIGGVALTGDDYLVEIEVEAIIGAAGMPD